MSTGKQNEGPWNGQGPTSSEKPCYRKLEGENEKLLENSDKRKFLPEMRHLIPLEVRKQYYKKVRAEIFNSGNFRKPVSERIRKIRELYKEKRNRKNCIIESVNRAGESGKDNRIYLEVEIEGKIIKGLLDSGASVSILGKGCREITEELELEITPIFYSVRTAGGQYHRILGMVNASVGYKGVRNNILFYLCPDLEQSLYLGIDFWRAFNLAPEVVGVGEIDIHR